VEEGGAQGIREVKKLSKQSERAAERVFSIEEGKACWNGPADQAQMNLAASIS
jgi:hypothetical protein